MKLFFLLTAETSVHVESTTSTTTKFVTPHLGASELNPSERGNSSLKPRITQLYILLLNFPAMNHTSNYS